jgi:hypothetical protein
VSVRACVYIQCMYVYTCHCSIVAQPWQSDLSYRFHLRGPRRLLCVCVCVCRAFGFRWCLWAATQHSTRTQEDAPVLQKEIHLGSLGFRVWGFDKDASTRAPVLQKSMPSSLNERSTLCSARTPPERPV